MRRWIQVAVLLPLLALPAWSQMINGGGNGSIPTTGTSGNCTLSINGVADIPQGIVNAASCGSLVSSTNVQTASMSNGLTAVALGSAGDFTNGEYVAIPHAGAAQTVATPTGLTVVSSKWQGAVYLTTTDGSGSTNASYQVVAVDALGGQSAAAAKVSIANSVASLTFDAFNLVSWSAVTNAVAYLVYGCVGAACTPALIALVPSVQTSFLDMAANSRFGTDSTDSSAVPAGALNQWLFTHITAGGGTTSLTVADAAGATVSSVRMVHDNSPTINSAITQNVNGGTVWVPPGSISIARTVTASAASGLRVQGAGSALNVGAAGTELIWAGPIGGTPLYVNTTRDSVFANFDVASRNGSGGTGNTPGRDISIDNVSPSGSHLSTNNTFDHILVDESGFGVELSDQGTTNNDIMKFTAVNCTNSGVAHFWLNNSQSKWNTFDQIGFCGRTYDIYDNAGSFSVRDSTLGAYIGMWVTNATDVLSAWHIQAEHTKRLLVTPTGSSGLNISISASRFVPTSVSGDKIYLYYGFHGALALSNNDFSDGNNTANWQMTCNNNAYDNNVCWTSVGNFYPNNNPFAGVTFTGAGAQGVVTQGDKFNDGSGNTIDLFRKDFTGTSGSATCVQTADGPKRTVCYLNGYANTGAAQTYSYQMPYNVGALTEGTTTGGSSCGTYNPTTTTTTLTLPANAAMTAETCSIQMIGQ
jgi:hypothetical protein